MTSTVLPIWVTDSFKPARAGLIGGETDLLHGLDIVRKLDTRVRFGSNQFRIGRGELGMMTFNEKHHWVSDLVATACAYAKLDEYFGKLQKLQMAPLQAHGDFGDRFGSSGSGQNQKSAVW